MKHVVITGVSTGIGKACAVKLAEEGFHVFGSIRNTEDARSLRKALGDSFTDLLFDVTDSDAIDRAAGLVAERIGTAGLCGLVNNAGIVIDGPLMHLPIDRLRLQFEVNLFGLLAVTQAFLPLLGARRDSPVRPGRVVNISSVSGRVAFPLMGAYAASKHAVEAVSDALRRELMIYGIDVIVVEPANVQTSVFEKAERVSAYRETDFGRYHQSVLDGLEDAMRHARPAETVADAVHTALTATNPKTRYVLAGRRLRWLIMSRLMPDRWVDRKLADRLRRLSRS